MALRNAFEELATDGLLRRIFNAVNLPRDSSGRQVVNVQAVPGAAQWFTMWSNGTYNSYYTTGSPNSMDAREEQKAIMRANAKQSRARWSIT